LAFCFLFHLSKLVQELWNFLWCFIWSVRDFTSDFWKILKVFLKKYWYVKYFFFQNSAVYYLFFYFCHFILNFVYLYLSKSSRNSYVFLFYGLEILSKNFGKSWNVYQKNIDIWNPKFFINSIVYYMFFYSFSILVIFFSYFTDPNLSKIMEFLWCFIGRVRDFTNDFLENSKSSFKKNIDMWNIFFFKILRFTICFFIFWLFLPFYFEFRLSILVKKF